MTSIARLYKIGTTGRILSGAELIAAAKKAFRTEVHGFGPSGYPTNIKKATGFLSRELRKNVYTKLESEAKWLEV